MTQNPIPLCVKTTQDIWLGDILGRCAFIISPDKEGEPLDQAVTRLRMQPSFASVKLPADDIGVSLDFQNAGFRQVDTALTFRCVDPLSSNHGKISFACKDDAESITQIAMSAFSNSRFHLDPRIDNQKADLIKGLWAANFFKGKRGQAMIVARDNQDSIIGFCQILRPDQDVAVIDLIAVRPDCTGIGAGRAMLSFIWSANPGGFPVSSILVGTQAANIGAVKFYENTGFRLIKAQNILHFSY